MEVERPFGKAFSILDFDADLTFFHSAHMSPRAGDELLSMTRIPPQLLTPAVRFHKDHVLLLVVPSGDTSEIARPLSDWFEQRGFVVEGTRRLFRAVTSTPVEDGFFTCLCAVNGRLRVPEVCGSTSRLKWAEFSSNANNTSRILADFVQEESQRIDRHGCTRFLDDLYATQSWRERDGRRLLFDTDDAYLEFATAVWSPNELYFWSRPIQIPK